MADNDGYSSRPEARPVPYWKHPKRAKEALKLIIRALKTTAENITRTDGNVTDLGLDTNRASRIFFVSGEPGSGKSTLYLTLRAMLSSREETTYSEGYPDQKSLGDLQGVVRLLDPIDLEVAGDEGENLLAAVLVRIIEALDKPDGVSNVVLSEPCKGAIKELEELATDIGIAWEGNLKARAGELDPDTYSVEVIRTQRARLRVNERLSNALNELAKHKCFDCDYKTLFVLPVDDFYLKPDASLQLLRLLRMISIPRLFFLVMGDINTVEALFIEKSLADWTAVAGTRLFPPGSERLDQALTRARELRARYLRKLLPPGQRETIEVMDWYEALNFEVGRAKTSAVEVEILEELLLRLDLDTPLHENEGKTDSLLTFLVSPSLPPLSSEEKQKRKKRAKGEKDAEKETPFELALRKPRTAYTALQILDATPREMIDLGAALREVIRKRQEREKNKSEGEEAVDNHTPLLLSCVRDIVNLVRDEHSFLNEKWQEVLGGVLPTRTYSPEDLNFQMDRLSLRPSPKPWKTFDSGKIWVRSHRSWDLTVNAKPAENQETEKAVKDPFAKLPPRPAAWFVLLHDLAWKWNQDSVTGNLVKNLCEDMKAWEWNPKKSELAPQPHADDSSQAIKDASMEAIKQFLSLFERLVNEWNKTETARIVEEKIDPNPQDDFRGWAVWGDDTRRYTHFPIPEFEVVRDLDHFLFIWSRALEWLGKAGRVEIDDLVSLWKLAGRTVLLEAYRDFGNGGDDWYKDFAQGGDSWFKDFIETRSTSFKAHFEEFSKRRGKLFEYPADGSEQIRAWRKKLDTWDNSVIVPKLER